MLRLLIYFLIPLLIIIGVSINGWEKTWFPLFFWTHEVPDYIIKIDFGDFRNIQSSTLSYLNGFDPRINNVFDQFGTNLIYPFIWVYIGDFFGLQNEMNFYIFIGIFVFIFLLSGYYLIKNSTNYYKFTIAVLLVFSQSNLLLIERGNIDLIIFGLICLAVIYRKFFIPLVFISSLLKIYPIVLLSIKFKNFKSSFFLTISVLILGFIFYEDILFSFNSAPTPGSFSYGSKVASYLIFTFLNLNISHYIISVFLTGISIFLYKYTDLKFINVLKNNQKDSEIIFFVVGSLIYCSTFIVSGNFDYRLVFVLLIMPIILKSKSFYIWSLVIFGSFNQRLLKYIFFNYNEYFGSGLNFVFKLILFVLLAYNLVLFFNDKIFNNYINKTLKIRHND